MKFTAPFLFTLIATSVAPVFAAPVPLQIEGRKFNPKDIHNTGHTGLNKRFRLPAGFWRNLGAVGIAGAVGSAVYVLISKPAKDILGLNKDEDAEAAAAAGADAANGRSPVPLGKRGLTQAKWSDLTDAEKQTWANIVADAILNSSITHFDASKLGMSQKEVKEIVARLAGHPNPRDALASELIKTLNAASSTEVSISKRAGGIAGAFATAFKSIGKGGILKELGIGLAGGAALVGAFGLLSKLMGGSKDTEAAAVPVPSDDENVVSKRSLREKRLAGLSSITSLLKGFGKFMTTPVTKAITNEAGQVVKAAGKTPLVTTMIAAIGSAAMAVGGLAAVEAFKDTKYKDIFSASTVKRDTGLESEHVIAKRINLKLGGVLGMAATGVVAIGSTLGAAWGVGKLYDVGKSFFLHKKPATVEAVPEDYTPVPEDSYENLD